MDFLKSCRVLLICLLSKLVFQANAGAQVKSPELAQLKKFIDMPVEYSNGLPDIHFQLFEFKSGELEYSPVIRYHAGGIKVGQRSTWIGMNWDFTGELSISQTIKGSDDFYAGGYPNNQNVIISGAITVPTTGYLRQLASGIQDEEPDEYQFNLLGKSGNFYFQKKADGSVNLVPVPYSPLRIFYNKTTDNFEITDIDGTFYRFGKGFNGVRPIEASFAITTIPSDGPKTWKCTEIISASKADTLFFEYYKPVERIDQEMSDKKTVYDGSLVHQAREHRDICIDGGQHAGIFAYDVQRIVEGNYNACEFLGTNKIGELLPSIVYRKTLSSKLKQVRSRAGQIDFNFNAQMYRLESVVLRDYNQAIINQVTFSQSLCYSPNFTNDIKLDEFSILGNGSSKEAQRYKFQYNKFDFSGGHLRNPYGFPDGSKSYSDYVVPRRESEYGLPPQAYSIEVSDPLNYDCNLYFTGGNGIIYPGSDERKLYQSIGVLPNKPYGSGLLSRITYPTGGYTNYTYYPHSVFDENPSSIPNSQLIAVGGARVETITAYAASGQTPTLKQTFKYGENESGAGILKAGAAFPYNYEQTIVYLNESGTDAIDRERARTYLETSTVSGILKGLGSHVFYPKVTVYEDNNGLSNGKTEYSYNHDVINRSPYDFTPGTPLAAKHAQWGLGSLKSIIDYAYSSQNGQYRWQRKKEYEYLKKYQGMIYGAMAFASTKVFQAENYLPNILDQHEYYAHLAYIIPVGNSLLEKETETYRDELNNELIQEKNFAYNDDFLLKETSVKGSKGQLLTTINKYPRDFTGEPVYDAMVNRNMIASPVEQIQKIDNLEIQRNRTVYSFWNGGSFIAPVTTDVKMGKSAYETQIRNYSYDTKANLTSSSKEHDVIKSYIWGYNSSYPVAEVIGASYNDIVTISNLNLDLIKNPTSEQALRNELNKIRISLPSAQVNTYTYKPLIGLTSLTDINNRLTFYEYDDHNRLKYIRDNEQLIVKKFEYSFAVK